MLKTVKYKKIFYYHVLTDRVLNIINNLIDNNKVCDLYTLINTSTNSNLCSIIADDAHISNKILLNNPKYDIIYFGIIGTRSILKPKQKIDIDLSILPDFKTNLQSANYYALLGNTAGFIPYDIIQNTSSRCLNHTWSHLKYFYDSNIIANFNISNPYNWHAGLYHPNKIPTDFNIYSSDILHLRSQLDAYLELDYNSRYDMNIDFVLAPWNEINDNFINAAKALRYKYIIHNKIFNLSTNEDFNDIIRINIDKLDLDNSMLNILS